MPEIHGPAGVETRPSQRAVNGDCSRGRRFADPVRRRYYARHRQERFARRMRGGKEENPFWRDQAERIVAALAERAGGKERAALLQALTTLTAPNACGETP